MIRLECPKVHYQLITLIAVMKYFKEHIQMVI